MREARIHVRHIRDLLKSINNHDAYQGVDCNSLSYLNVITSGDILGWFKFELDLGLSLALDLVNIYSCNSS